MNNTLLSRLQGIYDTARQLDISGEDARQRVIALGENHRQLLSLISEPGQLYRDGAELLLNGFQTNRVIDEKFNTGRSVETQLRFFENENRFFSPYSLDLIEYKEKKDTFAQLLPVPHLEMGHRHHLNRNALIGGFAIGTTIVSSLVAVGLAVDPQFGFKGYRIPEYAYWASAIAIPTISLAIASLIADQRTMSYDAKSKIAHEHARQLDYLIDTALNAPSNI